MNALRFISNIFCPPKCIFCGKLIGVNSYYNHCDKCMTELKIKSERICEVCGRPIDIPRGDLICFTCANERYDFNRNIAPFLYKGTVKDAILTMKFSANQQWIAYSFGEILAQRIIELCGDITFDGIAYVPISKKRYEKRGYNQAEIIALSVGKTLDIPVLKDTLIKFKDTPKQSTLSAIERRKNIKGSYKPGKTDVTDKVILLIDDVLTTGSTMSECAKILKKSGAVLVYGATIAVTEGWNKKCRLRGKRLRVTKRSSTYYTK